MTPEQVRALRESAANIIAHEKQLEGQRAKLYTELEKVNTRARQAVMMAEEASQDGDAEKAARFNDSAGILSQEIVNIDTQIAAIDIELIEARQASEEAKSIASDSAIQTTQMKAKGAELRADFEKAKMAEAENAASASSTSFEAVKGKIDNRVAQAEAHAELAEVEGQGDLAGATAMVEQAALEAKAAARLAEIRSQMGVGSPGASAEAEPVVDAPQVDEPQDAARDDAPSEDGDDPSGDPSTPA